MHYYVTHSKRECLRVYAWLEFIPVSLLSIIKYHWDMAHGHRFTANKVCIFIRNEFRGRAKIKRKKRIINGKST